MAQPARGPHQRRRELVDEEVVVDDNGPGPLISSRKPDDLPAFTKELLARL